MKDIIRLHDRSKYNKVPVKDNYYDLRNLVDSDNFPYYYEIDTNKSYSGSWLGEYIDGQYYRRYTDKAQTIVDTDYTKKGITLDGKGGNDGIDGSMYSDTIKGGDGDDTIYGERGNDIITAGTGKNTINYKFGTESGNDVINLTKGENFVLKIDSLEGIKYEYSSNKKDLIIYKINNNDGKMVEQNYSIPDVGCRTFFVTTATTPVDNIESTNLDFNFDTKTRLITISEDAQITLYSITGAKVVSTFGQSISLDNVTPGIYFVQINSSQKNILEKIMVK